MEDRDVVDLLDGLPAPEPLQERQRRRTGRGLAGADGLAIHQQHAPRTGQRTGRGQPAEAGAHDDRVPPVLSHRTERILLTRMPLAAYSPAATRNVTR